MLTENLVHIWQIDLDPTPSHSDLLRSVLTGDDLCRAGKISDPSVRSRFEVAHGAARLILGRYLVMPPTLLSWQTGPWGKPTIAGHEHTLRFSLSRSAGIALLAVTGPRDVGVDIERPQEGRNFLALSRKYFPYEESALVASADNSDRAETFVRLWTRKEACTKAAGTRMLGRGLRIPVADFPETTRGVLVHDPTGNVPGVWLVFDVPVPAGYHAAVALDGHEPAQVTMRRWQP